MNVELTHPWTWKKIPLWIRNWVQFYVPMDPSDKFAFWFGGSKEQQSWCHNLNGIEMHGSGNDMRMICAYAFSLKMWQGMKWYEEFQRSHEISQIGLHMKYNLMVVLDKCVPQQTSNFVGWLPTANDTILVAWMGGYTLLCKSDTIPPLQNNTKEVAQFLFSSSRFPSILFLQLMAIITIFSLLILLTFNFHVVSVSYIVTFKKCLSDDKHLCL